jgi:hypothetical protein
VATTIAEAMTTSARNAQIWARKGEANAMMRRTVARDTGRTVAGSVE